MSSRVHENWMGPLPIQQFMVSFFDFTSPPSLCEQLDSSSKSWQTHFGTLGTCYDASELCSRIRELITTSGALHGMSVVSQAWEEPSAKGHHQSGQTTLALFSDEDLPRATTLSSRLHSMQLCITAKLTKPRRQENGAEDDSSVSDSGTSSHGTSVERDDHEEHCQAPFALEGARGKDCVRCMDELLSYAKTILNHQHRTHVFMIQMAGTHARFIRFDRGGAVVSAPFDYSQRGDLLLAFLWRFSRSNEETKGRDPTVTRATAVETVLAKEKLFKWIQEDGDDWPVYKLIIQDQDLDRSTERKKMEVLVWAPVAQPTSVAGKATRGYVGYDACSDKVVFVKDSWRSTEPAMEKESDTLRTINSAGITERVPVLLCGDDLEGVWQSTVTARYLQGKWSVGNQRRCSRRTHTRFATDKVGTPLEEFENSKDFLKAVYDAFRAHRDVYEKCNILHCDVSLGNILVDTDGKGFLNDWDLARAIEAIETGPERTFCSGTWRFMSACLVGRPDKVHTLQDDIESFFWVVAYTIIRFLYSSYTSDLTTVIKVIFDEYRSGSVGRRIGGLGKLSHLSGFCYPRTLIVSNNPPMTRFYKRFRMLLIAYLEFERDVRISLPETPSARRRDWERQLYSALRTQIPSSPLVSHEAVGSLFAEILAVNGWPPNDSSHDYLSESSTKAEDEGEESDSSNKVSRCRRRL